jgi:hypothetical protein
MYMYFINLYARRTTTAQFFTQKKKKKILGILTFDAGSLRRMLISCLLDPWRRMFSKYYSHCQCEKSVVKM